MSLSGLAQVGNEVISSGIQTGGVASFRDEQRDSIGRF
jgi:hypothetical protein